LDPLNGGELAMDFPCLEKLAKGRMRVEPARTSRMTGPFHLPEDFAARSWQREPARLRWEAPAPFDADALHRICERLPAASLSFEARHPPEPAAGEHRGRVSILSRLDRHLPASRPWLATLYRGIEAAVGHFPDFDPTAFLQTRRAGMETHFDTGDVFSVQLEGRKVWSLFPGELVPGDLRAERERLPRAGGGERVHRFYEQVVLPEPRVFELSPGDVLYVPACWMHATFSPEPSLSLSVSPRMFSLAEWIGRAVTGSLQEGSSDAFTMVPPPPPTTDGLLSFPESAAADAAALLRNLDDVGALADAWYRWQSRGWFDPPPTASARLRPSDELELAPGARRILVRPSGSERVRLYLAGERLDLPAELLPCVDACSQRPSATVEGRLRDAAAKDFPVEVASRVVELLHRSSYLVRPA
jgi:hypothetical protein